MHQTGPPTTAYLLEKNNLPLGTDLLDTAAASWSLGAGGDPNGLCGSSATSLRVCLLTERRSVIWNSAYAPALKGGTDESPSGTNAGLANTFLSAC